jgi:plastocyanin
LNRIAMLAAVLAAALGTAAAAQAATPKLVGLVADPLTISLTQGGKKVTHLKPGIYVIVVKDEASDHNFHLSGPGVNKLTSVGGKATFTWKVTLKKGTYTYVCDPHAAFMKGSIAVR